MQIGYFGSPKRYTRTHLVENGKPICGSKIGEDLRFQWCANIKNPVNLHFNTNRYVECMHCIGIVEKQVAKKCQEFAENCQKHKKSKPTKK